MSEQRPWTEKETSCLGTQSDREIATSLGRTEESVRAKRTALAIPPAALRLKRWTANEDGLLGSAPDDEVAKQLGRTRVAVTARRCALGIVSANAKGPVLSPEEHLPAAAPDPDALKQLKSIEVPREGLSQEDEERFKLLHGPYYPPRTARGKFMVCEWRGTVRVGGYSDAPIPWPYAFRTGLDRASRNALAKPWTPEEIELLGTKPDRVLARKFKRSARSVQQKRKSLGIPSCTGRRFWRAADDNLLGKYADEDVARFLKVSVAAVVVRRSKLGIAIKDPQVRPWSGAEEQLLGTLPDEEVAKRLGRSLLSVRTKRRKTGRPYPTSKIRYWTADEDAMLGTKPDEEVARQLGRSLQAARLRRHRLGIHDGSIGYQGVAPRPSSREEDPQSPG